MSLIGTPRGVRRSWQRVQLDLEQACAALAKLSPPGVRGVVEAVGWFENRQLRRIEAVDSDGWTVSMRVYRDGSIEIIRAFQLRLVATGPELQAAVEADARHHVDA